MTDDYTPQTQMIKRAWILYVASLLDRPDEVAEAEFERWLLQHDRHVAQLAVTAERWLREQLGDIVRAIGETQDRAQAEMEEVQQAAEASTHGADDLADDYADHPEASPDVIEEGTYPNCGCYDPGPNSHASGIGTCWPECRR